MAEVVIDIRSASERPGAPPLDDAARAALARLGEARTLALGRDDLGAPTLHLDEDDVIEWKRLDLSRRVHVVRAMGRSHDGVWLGLVFVYGPVDLLDPAETEALVETIAAHGRLEHGPLVTPFVALHDALPRTALAFAVGPEPTRVQATQALQDAEDAGVDGCVVRTGTGLHALSDADWIAWIDGLLRGAPPALPPAQPARAGALTTLAPGRIGVVQSQGWLRPWDLPRADAPWRRPFGPAFLAPSTYARALPGRTDVALAITSLDGVLHRQILRVTEAVAPLLSTEDP